MRCSSRSPRRSPAATSSRSAVTGLNTRRAPRFPVFTPAEAVIDGTPTNLVDISVLGAQVVSDPVLRPKQKIKIALPDVEETILRFTAHVAWSVFEKPRPEKAPHYRAGMEFNDATALALEAYCQRHCSNSPTPIR
jgi:hypothetical protein